MKTLIIGGHTDGIGDAVARTLLSSGGRIGWMVYKPTVRELDVRDETTIDDYIGKHGPFDEIVYSAGMSKLSWIRDTNVFNFGEVIDVNLTGLVLVASVHERQWPKAEVRCAVVVSDASDTPMRGSIAYCASKAGLEMAVRVMARELAPRWITVAVSPGVVEDTAMTRALAEEIPAFRNWTPEQARQYEDAGSVLGRRVAKQEVVETVLFALTGPEALNGSTITINGGK